MGEREPPKPEQFIAGVAAFASFIGLVPALFVGGLCVIKAAGADRFPHGHYLVAFGIACVGVLSGMLAVFVREVQVALRKVGITNGEIARGMILGDLLVSMGVLALWAAWEFRAGFMFAPLLGVWMGAYLSACHVSPFGRVPTIDNASVIPE